MHLKPGRPQCHIFPYFQYFSFFTESLAKTGLPNDNYRAAHSFNCPNTTEARKRKYSKETAHLLLSFREARFVGKIFEIVLLTINRIGFHRPKFLFLPDN